VLRIKIRFQNISLIKLHATTDEIEELKKEVLCQKVEEICDSCPSNDVK
jgi:hypothetical protein